MASECYPFLLSRTRLYHIMSLMGTSKQPPFFWIPIIIEHLACTEPELFVFVHVHLHSSHVHSSRLQGRSINWGLGIAKTAATSVPRVELLCN